MTSSLHNITLPPGWKWTTLGDICLVVRGASPRPMGNPKYYGGAIPFLKIADVTRVQGKFVFSSDTHVNDLGAEKSRLLKKGTLILTNSATVCVPKFLGVDACIHDGFVGFLGFKTDISLDFLFHYFDYFRPFVIQKHRQGVTQVNLNTGIVKGFDIPLPPLPEQYRIVEKIEALFSELDKGVEQLKTAQQQLKVYRQSVLKWAFEGKLTAEWRKSQISNPKSQTARDLLSRIKQEREALAQTTGKRLKPIAPLTEKELADLPELPTGWTWVRVHEVAESSLGKMLDQEKNKGVLQQYLRNINVRWGSFDLEDLSQMRFEEDEAERFGIKQGDLIVCEGGEPGRCAVWKEQVPDMKIQKALHRVRFINAVKPDYAFYFMLLSGMAKAFEEYFTGTTIKHLTGESLNTYPLPICVIAEQHQIVQEIESRLSVCDKLEETIAASLQQAQALRQSILKKAFEGKLVPQDPSDPPASELLQSISEKKKSHENDETNRAKRKTI